MNGRKLFQFNKYRSKKRRFVLLICFFALLFTFFHATMLVSADNGESGDMESSISSGASAVLDGIDLGDLDELVSSLDTLSIFSSDVKSKISDILSGEYFTDYSSLFTAIISLVFGDIREILPFIFTILAIGILSNLLSQFRTDSGGDDVVFFVSFSVLIITILFAFKNILSITYSTIKSIRQQMQIIFPILLTLLSSIGSLSSVSIFNPLVAILTTIVSVVFEKFLYPIFIVLLLFTILGSLTKNIKLDKFQSFLGSVFKWSTGMVFTLFAGILSLQGISAGKFDSVSIKATKFAVKSYIPIIGSYISDGMDFLVHGSVLVKNTIGLVGVIILFLSIISPIVNIVVVKLALSLSASVLDLSGNSRMSNFLLSCSKILIYPIVIILGVAFMYIITIALVMCTANII